MKKYLLIIIIVLVISGFGTAWKLTKKEAPLLVTDFQECVAAGNPVMESYPRQCRHADETFTEDIGNELEKADLIHISSPRPNEAIKSPLTITGEARGSWFFEASFPVVLTDWDGLIIAEGIASAKSNWMTSEFVPFEATLTFTVDKEVYSNRGALILRKDNPSGLPEHDDALEIPIIFDGVKGSKACTAEAMICPDGSSVGRTGPNCEFTACPTIYPKPITECKKDSDCSSPLYTCQEKEGVGTMCTDNDPSCISTYEITKGECKLKNGSGCRADFDCESGNLCISKICTNPIGRQCNDQNDTSCPSNFECVQGCGSPVGYKDEPPVPYYCQLKGYNRVCPICLAKNTLIDTPYGTVPVEEVEVGTDVWTVNKSGERVIGTINEIGKTHVAPDHMMVRLVLDDDRTVFVSPKHPAVNRRNVGDLSVGDLYDGGWVVSTQQVQYEDEYTYDILPSGETGFYFANGILLDSTLRNSE